MNFREKEKLNLIKRNRSKSLGNSGNSSNNKSKISYIILLLLLVYISLSFIIFFISFSEKELERSPQSNQDATEASKYMKDTTFQMLPLRSRHNAMLMTGYTYQSSSSSSSMTSNEKSLNEKDTNENEENVINQGLQNERSKAEVEQVQNKRYMRFEQAHLQGNENSNNGLKKTMTNINNNNKNDDKEVSDVCGIVAYFNPAMYKTKIDIYRKFRKRIKQQGLKIIAVELAYDNRPYELSEKSDDAEYIVRVRGLLEKTSLWQKERLLNIALHAMSNQPLNWSWCKKVVWIDTEVIIDNNQWIAITSKLLDRYSVVQPFSHCIRLPKESDWVDPIRAKQGKYEGQISQGIASLLVEAREQNILSSSLSDEERSSAQHIPKDVFGGYTGFVWAARRSVLDSIGGFYEGSVLGGADVLMANAFLGNFWKGHQNQRLNGLQIKPEYYKRVFPSPDLDGFENHFSSFAEKAFNTIKGNVGAPSERVILYHLWHGAKENRGYEERYKVLRESKYDPQKHVEFGNTELKYKNPLSWTSLAYETALPNWAKNLFWMRKESLNT